MEYAFVWGGSAGELCLSCAAPIVIETRVMNKTCDPVSIRVQGLDPEFRVPGFCGLTTVLGRGFGCMGWETVSRSGAGKYLYTTRDIHEKPGRRPGLWCLSRVVGIPLETEFPRKRI